MMGISAILIIILGGMTIKLNGNGVGISYLPTILLILVGWTIQGSTEEILTRGWMLPRLTKRYSFTIGIIVSSVLFTSLHLTNSGITIISVINLTLFAVFASLFSAFRGDIWGICGFHVAWNWMQGNIIGVEVSGMTVPGGTLIKLTSQGNSLISGGSFGIEGSVIVSIVFLIAIIYLIIKLRKTGINKDLLYCIN